MRFNKVIFTLVFMFTLVFTLSILSDSSEAAYPNPGTCASDTRAETCGDGINWCLLTGYGYPYDECCSGSGPTVCSPPPPPPQPCQPSTTCGSWSQTGVDGSGCGSRSCNNGCGSSWTQSYTCSTCSNSCRGESTAGSCVGGWVFAGYTESCTYPSNCCINQAAANACGTGDTSAPSCGPPPPSCGDSICNGNERCATSTTENNDNGQCYTDCRLCRPNQYPSESTWCSNNCIGNNAAQSPYTQYCGVGFGASSTAATYSGYYCDPPIAAGQICGTEAACEGPAVCGDSILMGSETCDDGNTANNDGCSSSCSVEFGYTCSGTGASSCTSDCGDGRKASNEACDNDIRNPAPLGGDGCSSTCTVETGWSCTGTNPSSCVFTASEECWDGIDNDFDGIIDENCGGCSDLDGDGDTDFEDFFILADCNPGGTNEHSDCRSGPIVFNKVDWNDNKQLEILSSFALGVESAGQKIADFNSDNSIDMTDFGILESEYGRTGSGLTTDLNYDDNVDLDDFFIFADQFGGSTQDYDFRCWAQQFIDPSLGRLACGSQVCEELRQGQVCYNDYQCNYKIGGTIPASKCSFGDKQQLTQGHCCPVGEFWDPNAAAGNGECVVKATKSCSNCGHTMFQSNGIPNAAFFSDADCFEPSTGWICINTRRFSREIQFIKTQDIS